MTVQRHEGTFGAVELDVQRRANSAHTNHPTQVPVPGSLVRD